MKKKLSLILLMLLILSLFTPAVFADDNSKFNDVVKQVEKTNQKIEKEIQKSIEVANYEIEKCEEEVAELNEKRTEADEEELVEIDCKILEYETKLFLKIDDIISNLIDKTNKLANEMVEKAAKEGITVICELIEVEIGGRTVLIDPLIIVNAG